MPDLSTVVATAAIDMTATCLAVVVTPIQGLSANVSKGYAIISAPDEANDVARVLFVSNEPGGCKPAGGLLGSCRAPE